MKYRFCRVIFGATCSQFLLNGTIRTHAKKYEKIDPEFARRVLKHFYVDDLTTGVSNVEEGVDLYNNIKSRFNEAQFNVRKWRTNNEELRAIINKKEKINNNINNNNTSRKNEKVLGIAWNEDNDTLILGVNELFESVINIEPTKRNILRVIASVYDPMGYIQPIIIKLKILFQEICLLNNRLGRSYWKSGN